MQLSAPRSLAEIAEDGRISQADIDFSFNQLLGSVTATECQRVSDDSFIVRFGRHNVPDLDYPAKLIATIRGDEWQWTSANAAEAARLFGVPELQGVYRGDIKLITRAARTIHRDAPVVRLPMPDLGIAVLALEVPVQPSHPRDALMRAPLNCTERAVTAFAVRRGLSEIPATLRDEAIYHLNPGLSPDELRTNAHFLAVEHQLLFDAKSIAQPTLAGGLINILTREGIVAAPATIIARVSANTWHWAPGAQGNRIRSFGQEHGIPALCLPALPVELAQRWEIIDWAKEILGLFTHAFVQVSTTEYAVVLFQAPEFSLPPATAEIAAAVLERALAPELDRAAAEQAYRARRGVPAS